jgi:hypothetical protein
MADPMPYTGPKNSKRGYWMQKEADREKKAGTKGALRKALHAKAGKNIPADKLAAAAKKGGHLGQMARMAERYKAAKH